MTRPLSGDTQVHWFLIGQACWFAAFGLQAVLFPYLIVNVLFESPDRVGLAQMCLMAPALALMVPGGMLADAVDLRTLLIRLQALAVLPVSILAWSIGVSGGAFVTLIAFALVHGSVQALVTPTRDALLGRIAGLDVQRMITTALGVQFAAQILGFCLASTASTFGVVPLLATQACLYVLSAACAAQMQKLPPIQRSVQAADESTKPGQLAELKAAFAQVWRSPKIGPVTGIMAGVGLFFISVFQVVVPVMVRDHYHGGSAELALVNAAFVVGVLVATTVMARIPPIQAQGMAIFLSACGGAILCLVFATQPSSFWFYACIWIFGAGAGVLMSLSRTVVQQTASDVFRARILAIYSLAFLGSAPIGALLVGQLAEWLGVLNASFVAGMGMVGLLVALALWGGILRVRAL